MSLSPVALLLDEIQAAANLEARVVMPGVRPAVSWALMAETELANRVIGSPDLRVQNIPVRPGLSRRVMTTAQEPPVRYEEEHYQWDEGVFTGGRRYFIEGPLEKFLFLFTHEPTAEGTLATLRFAFGGRGAEGAATAKATRDGFAPLLKQLAEALAAAPQREPPELHGAQGAFGRCGHAGPARALRRLQHRVRRRPRQEPAAYVRADARSTAGRVIVGLHCRARAHAARQSPGLRTFGCKHSAGPRGAAGRPSVGPTGCAHSLKRASRICAVTSRRCRRKRCCAVSRAPACTFTTARGAW